MEKAFQQAMVAKNLQSPHLTGRRQTCAVVLFVFHEGRLLGCQLLQHSSDGSSADTEIMREGVAGHAFLSRPGQFQ
jgi:hypothetical protein